MNNNYCSNKIKTLQELILKINTNKLTNLQLKEIVKNIVISYIKDLETLKKYITIEDDATMDFLSNDSSTTDYLN